MYQRHALPTFMTALTAACTTKMPNDVHWHAVPFIENEWEQLVSGRVFCMQATAACPLYGYGVCAAA